MKSKVIFIAFTVFFALCAFIAFWFWYFDQCWQLAVVTLWMLTLGLVAFFCYQSVKKLNI